MSWTEMTKSAQVRKQTYATHHPYSVKGWNYNIMISICSACMRSLVHFQVLENDSDSNAYSCFSRDFTFFNLNFLINLIQNPKQKKSWSMSDKTQCWKSEQHWVGLYFQYLNLSTKFQRLSFWCSLSNNDITWHRFVI